MSKKRIIIISTVLLLCLVIVIGTVVAMKTGKAEEVTYRETEVKYGNLAVGVTENGSVDIGTVEQTFDLDMSALQRVNTGSGESGGGNSGSGAQGFGGMGNNFGGGFNMFDQIFNMADNNTFSQRGTDSSLTIAQIPVSVGQQISVGDVLYELEEESVTELTEELETNVEKAKADLDAVYADRKLSEQQAQYTYDTSVAYGDYAQVEYNTTGEQLRQEVTEAERQLADAKTSLADYQAQLEEMTKALTDAEKVLKDAEWARDNVDKKNNLGRYVENYQLVQSTQQTADSLKQKKERLEQTVEQAQTNLETAQKNLNRAQRNLAQGSLEAEETLELRLLAYNTAQETYDIALAYLEDTAAEQEETYADTLAKWEEYSSYIDGTAIKSQYNGVITGIDLEVGDSINTGTVLVSLYNMDEVTMTVTLYEEDMADIAVGSEAAICFTAYPENIFYAAVTEIADAETDSVGNVTYDVTVTLEGDVSGLFQGMTGEITFITEKTEDVLYVSRRAIITEGESTYVKVRDDAGKVQKVKVTTGFTDGSNTEIVEGLSEGDVVLIESKVSRK